MSLNSAGGRRFLLVVGAGIVATVLVWFTKITSGDYVAIILGTVAAYITGNTYESIKGAKNADA